MSTWRVIVSGTQRLWQRDDGVATTRIAVAHRWRARWSALTLDERRALRTRGLTAARTDAWIRGRMLVHHLLGARTTVAIDSDGAATLGDRGVALSHDGAWTAALITAAHRAAIDVVVADDRRAAFALRRVRWRGSARPAMAWAAFECALKLRRLPIECLLDRPVAAERVGARLEVGGLGAPVVVSLARLERATVAWTVEDEA